MPWILEFPPQHTPSYADDWRAIISSTVIHLYDYVKGSQKGQEYAFPSPAQDEYFFRNLSDWITRVLKDNNISTTVIVIKVCRTLEKVFINELCSGETLSWDELNLVESFFQGLEGGVVNQWIKYDTIKYRKKLDEANRFILLEKRRYYTIFNRMNEPAFIIDKETHIIDTNKAFTEFFSLDGREHLGKTCGEVLGEEVCSHLPLDRMLFSKKSFAGVEVVINKGTQKRIVLFSGTYLGKINNKFSGAILGMQDITYNRQAEKALQESEEKYRSLIENVPDVTWRADQYGNLVYVSPNLQKVCGYTPAELMDKGSLNRFIRIHPEDADRVITEFNRFFAYYLPPGKVVRDLHAEERVPLESDFAYRRAEKYDVRYRFQKKNGEWIWLHDRASKIYQKSGGWFTDGVFSDISELKRAEEELEKHHFRMAELVDERTAELRKTNELLEQEVKIRRQAEAELLELAARLKLSNEELEQFAHVASHDLKEPLTLILAFGERLRAKYSNQLDRRGVEYIRRLVKAANQMSCLVNDLLELSRISTVASDFEEVDLTHLVAEVNGDIITLSELNERAEPYFNTIRAQAHPSIVKEEIAKARQEVLNLIIDQLIIRQEAEKYGIHIAQSDIEAAIDSIAKENNITREEFQKELEGIGTNEQSYKLRLENQLLRSRMVNFEIRSKLIITDERVKEYYDNSYAGNENTPEGFHILQIGFLWGQNYTSKTKGEALILAQKVQKEIAADTDFRSLAEQYSDLPSAEDGGDIGVFKENEMAPYMIEAISQMKPGESSKIIETPSGFQILKLISAKRDGVTTKPPLESVTKEIEELIYKQEMEKRYETWMNELRDKAFITKNI